MARLDALTHRIHLLAATALLAGVAVAGQAATSFADGLVLAAPEGDGGVSADAEIRIIVAARESTPLSWVRIHRRGTLVLSEEVRTPPFEFAVQSPRRLGQFTVEAFGETQAGESVHGALTLELKPRRWPDGARVESIVVVPRSLEFKYAETTENLNVNGVLTNGARVMMEYAYTGTTYRTESGSSAVVRVTADGEVVPTGNGIDVVVVQNGEAEARVPVSVTLGPSPRCGDGVVSIEVGETCDDGNADPGDGCDSRCHHERASPSTTPTPSATVQPPTPSSGPTSVEPSPSVLPSSSPTAGPTADPGATPTPGVTASPTPASPSPTVTPYEPVPVGCYKAVPAKAPKGAPAFPEFTGRRGDRVVDASAARTLNANKILSVCNSASLTPHPSAGAPATSHFSGYSSSLTASKPAQKAPVRVAREVATQFGTLKLNVAGLAGLLLPASQSVGSGGAPPAPSLSLADPFSCYRVTVAKATKGQLPFPVFSPIVVTLTDSFAASRMYDVKSPSRLCSPADINGWAPGAETHSKHLMCYRVAVARTRPPQPKVESKRVSTTTAFGAVVLDAGPLNEVCVPAVVN